MKLLFVCPDTENSFLTDEFRLENNRGIVTNAEGDRSLQADVIVTICPHCHKSHTYQANKLSCPWSAKN